MFVFFRNFAPVNNPLSIFRLLFKAVKPSRTVDMAAVCDAFWLRRGYDALTFFGFILTHSRQEADHFNFEGEINSAIKKAKKAKLPSKKMLKGAEK